MNEKKGNLIPEDIENIRQSLTNVSRVENTVRCVSIAMGMLEIPRDEDLYEAIRYLIYTEGNSFLESTGTGVIIPDGFWKIHTDSNKRILKRKTAENILWKLQDEDLVGNVIRSIASSIDSVLHIPINAKSVRNLIDQEKIKAQESVQKYLSPLGESREATHEDIASENFRIDSTEWRETILPNGVRIKINPKGDVTELLEGEFAWEQHFSYNAMIRETEKAGKRVPSNDDWESIIRSINPDIVFGEYPQIDTSVRETLGLKLSGYQHGSNGSYREQGTKGFFWSSTSVSVYGYYVTVENNKIEPIRSTSKIHMFSVRCFK